MKNNYLLIPLLIIININVFGQSTPKYADLSLSFEERTKDMLAHMTLEEKIAQIGNNAPAIPRLGIQAHEYWNEALHGVARAGIATVFPQAIGMAASFDRAMMKQVADVISQEARAKHHEAARNGDFSRYKGLTIWSPNINIARDPRWGRAHETYGEDPYLTGQLGMQFVKGLQGDHPKYLKLVATPKHYAVHNGPEGDRHFININPNTRDLWETYLPAFEDVIVDAKAYSIMSAYNRVDGESASASWLLLEDILRNKWGFEGFVVSDCGAIRDIQKYHKIVNTLEEAAAIGVRKGCDLNCGAVYQEYLKNAIELGLIDEGEIDLAVYRVLLGRMKLGMFDPAENVPFTQIPIEVNDSKAHDEVALKMAQKSMTLLKNDGVLPLNRKKTKHIAVVGPNAKSLVALRSNYNGDMARPVTVLEGIKNAVERNTKITYNEGVPLVVSQELAVGFEVVESKYLSVEIDGKTRQGLKGEYFPNRYKIENPNYSKIDEQINFRWNDISPSATDVAQGILTPEKAIGNDRYAIRWTGKITAPKSGKYEFGVVSNDGCRLWIDDEKILDGWYGHDFTLFTGEVELEEGKSYDIRLDFFEHNGEDGVTLAWKLPGTNTDDLEDPLTLSKRVLADVKAADVAVFVGGLDVSWETEELAGMVGIDGFDRGDRTKITLPKTQLDALKAMVATGTPVVMVLMSGGAMTFDGIEEELGALLMSYYPGQRGGDAVADVLFGDYNPAGRLPVTFYSSTEDLGSIIDYNMRAGEGFTYRYHTGKPLYPFGHGLSYTKFAYSDMEISKSEVTAEEEITVSVTVKNIGKCLGEEVVQLYVKDVQSEKWMPIKQLRGFERIALDKGELKTITFTLNPKKDFRHYNSMKRKYEVELGDFEIELGASSSDIRLTKTVQVKE